MRAAVVGGAHPGTEVAAFRSSSMETKFGRRMPSVLAISVWLRPGFLSNSSSTENCRRRQPCSGATQRRKSSNTFNCARLRT